MPVNIPPRLCWKDHSSKFKIWQIKPIQLYLERKTSIYQVGPNSNSSQVDHSQGPVNATELNIRLTIYSGDWNGSTIEVLCTVMLGGPMCFRNHVGFYAHWFVACRKGESRGYGFQITLVARTSRESILKEDGFDNARKYDIRVLLSGNGWKRLPKL